MNHTQNLKSENKLMNEPIWKILVFGICGISTNHRDSMVHTKVAKQIKRLHI